MESTTEAASNSLLSADPFSGGEGKSYKDVVLESGEGLNGVVEGNGDVVEKSFKDVGVESGEGLSLGSGENGVVKGNGDVVEKSYKDVGVESGEGLSLGSGENGVLEGNGDVVEKSFKDVVVESAEGLSLESGENGVVEGNGDVVEKSFKDVVVESGEGLSLESGENGVVEGNGDFVEKSIKDVVLESGEGLDPGPGENEVVEGNEDFVEKSFKDVVVESGEDLNGVVEGNSDVEKSFKDVVVEDGKGLNGVVEGISDVVEKSFIDVVVESGEELSGKVDVVTEGVFEENKVSEFSEGLGSGVEEIKMEGEEVLEVKKMEGVSQVVEKHVESSESEEVGDVVVDSGDGVEVKHVGDAVVETIKVDLLEPGVAVVGEMEGNGRADRSASLNAESDEVSAGTVEEGSVQNIIAPSKSELSELDGAKLIPYVDSVEEVDGVASSNNAADQDHDVKTTSEGDSVIEKVQVDMSEPGVAVVGKLEENGQADAKASAKLENPAEEVEIFTRNSVAADDFDAVDVPHTAGSFPSNAEEHVRDDDFSANVEDKMIENGVSEKSCANDFAESNQLQNKELEVKDEINFGKNEASEDDLEGSGSEGDSDDMIFGSSEAAKQFIEELERGSEGNSNSGAESSHDNEQGIDGQIVTDSEEDTDEEGEGKELFDSAALTALLKAATGAGSDGGNITFTSPDGSGLFSIERPVGLGSSTQFLRPAPRANRSNIFTPSSFGGGEESENLSAEEKGKLEKLQSVRVKFLRLVQRLGMSSDDPIASRVLYRLALVAGRQTGQLFSLDSAKETALQLEEDEKEDLDFSLNILVLGKSGVGKSATINAIFGEEKARVDAFQHATTTVKEIIGVVDGVKIRVIDTPGLKSSVLEQSFNQSILSSVKKFTKKNPADIVLYVDRLDAQTRDLNDLPLMSTITSSLGTPIWRSVIVTLTHAASAPPEGASGSPLSYDSFVTQRSHIVQQVIGRACGDLRMMSPSLMNPVCLVENHGSCRRNREGQKVLPNGQSWRPQLMILCYSTKILSEANSISSPQDLFDSRKLFAFRTRPAPLAYMLSSMLQSRVHPKLSSEQGGDIGDSDIDLADLSDSDQEDEDEYDQLPPFKPLRKSQLAKLSVEQKKAYFEEYDYRVKLLQKKQWREELKRLKEMKMKGKDSANDNGYSGEDPDADSPAPVSVPLPDMALPPSFDGDNPAHRYRFLEPTSQFLARPVLDTHGWDHDCGYDGVNLEQSLAILSQFPAVVSVQLTKDKKEFTVSLDSSIAAKHGENGSSMAGFDIQNMGKQLAYIIRGETKFKNFRKNKTSAGISVTFLGENVVSGLKVEDQISFGKQYSLVASGGTVRSQQDVAYGANIELQRRELDYPIGQVQSSLGLSLIKFRGELAMGFNSVAQFSIGRNSKVTVRGAINNKLTGQISIRTSSSEHLSLVLASILPVAVTIYKKLFPVGEKFSIY
ncbi:translocase of chloroplast 159, chloroplastic [Heracleum sosnowskyi]|uniref:Translocase of chloroplast 159, chloroplastic n=1 Tax=Heracleum sosnowskyi TaxID=360622 RepID=A0AAD8GZK2_9APIA|nr:translocase of chloroplast 159, chloroplastic [Heracleum sosnowskyi]